MVSAEKRLKETFKPDSYLFDLSRTDSRYRRYENPDELMKELKKDVWRVLIDRMELRRILSVKRNEELNKQIETGQDLPDIDEAQILAMLDRNHNLHLEFKRPELVERRNAVAGGMRLRGDPRTKEATRIDLPASPEMATSGSRSF